MIFLGRSTLSMMYRLALWFDDLHFIRQHNSSSTSSSGTRYKYVSQTYAYYQSARKNEHNGKTMMHKTGGNAAHGGACVSNHRKNKTMAIKILSMFDPMRHVSPPGIIIFTRRCI